MVTIYDVAKKVGCASSTVSRALNGTRKVNPELKSEIIKAAEEMGYVANINARNLISSQSWTMGVIYHESLELGLEHQHFGGILEAFKQYVEERGYDITFVSRRTGDIKQTYLEWCKSRSIIGVLIVTIGHSDEQLVELIQSDLPVVSVNKVNLNCSVISSDDEAGASLAMNFFHEKGLSRVGHISMPLVSLSGKVRRETYQDIIVQWNIPDKEDLLVISNGYEYQDGYDAANKLISQCERLPEGIFVGSDMLAIGAIKALSDNGIKVPDDIEVIGFDDIEMAKYVTPSLTTIAQNKHLIGEEAAKYLIAATKGENEKRNDFSKKVPVDLKKRESCR